MFVIHEKGNLIVVGSDDKMYDQLYALVIIKYTTLNFIDSVDNKICYLFNYIGSIHTSH